MAKQMPDLSGLSDEQRQILFDGTAKVLVALDKIAPARPPGYVGTVGAEDMLQGMVAKASAVPVAKAVAEKASVYSVTNPNHIIPVNDPAAISAVNHAIPLDAHGHVIPPAGAETLGQALADLPNDAADWFGSHDLFGGVTAWFHHLDLAGPLLSLTQLVTGIAPWLTVALLGIKIIDMGGNMIGRNRAPVNLVYYQVPTPTVLPVLSYLQNGAQVEVRETVPYGDHTRIGVPAWHSGPADRAFSHLQQRTGLEYTRI